MNHLVLIYSIGTGLLVGGMYGMLFAYQHILPAEPHQLNIVRSSLLSVVRLLSLAALWYFILKSPLLNSILILTVFFVSFWTVILAVKGRQ